MTESLDHKLQAYLREVHVEITDGMCGYKGTLAPGSVRTVAVRVMAIVRQHDEERGAQFTREQLAAAIDQVRDAGFGDWGAPPFGYDIEAGDIAGRLVEALARNADMLRPGRAFHVEPEPVVDAHVCCEHADLDREIAAMAALLAALPLVSSLKYDARERVIDWYRRRVNDGMAPF